MEDTADDAKRVIFDYKTKGMMALIGQRSGVGILLDIGTWIYSLVALAFIFLFFQL